MPHTHAWTKSKRPGPSAVCKFDGELRFRRENVQQGASLAIVIHTFLDDTRVSIAYTHTF